PSMRMSPQDQANFIKNHLGPTLAKQKIGTKIIAYDHNWDNISYSETVLGDPEAAPYIDGSAWHCYAGEPSAQSAIHNSQPDKNVYFTECSGGEWASDFADNLAWNVSTLIVGTTRNYAKAVLLWNMALDESFGPQNGGCADCRGVVTIKANGDVVKNVEYYAIGHASKFVDAGAVRIGSDEEADTLEQVSFKNPDDSIVLIATNTGDIDASFKVTWNDKSFSYSLPRKSVATFKWSGDK
ncbi:MAG: glucan endo-1,6-beta-glucosidase, partial [Gorillibacterium sp.]|nr:glucan endo-1,6-beta-glucosidase [Gorillibacterium sp.]